MLAADVWGDDLRSRCHSLAVQWIDLLPIGTWHDGDHDRVLAYIASLPIALKMDLRGSRDVRELKGLLSQQDIGKIHCAESMAWHCIDVIKSYYISATAHKDSMEIPHNVRGTKRLSKFTADLLQLELDVTTSQFIRSVKSSRADVLLLRLMLGIWMLFLPFAVAEKSGTNSTLGPIAILP